MKIKPRISCVGGSDCQLTTHQTNEINTKLAKIILSILLQSVQMCLIMFQNTGACPGFLKGGGPISLGSLKKGHQILKGGVQWSDQGGPVH